MLAIQKRWSRTGIFFHKRTQNGIIGIEMQKRSARLGLIIPSSNTTVEKEFTQMTSPHPWISVHFARIPLREVTPQALEDMIEDIEEAASLLADASVDAICLACTSASFAGGKEMPRKLKHRIEKLTGIPSITTSEAVVMALEALKTRHLALVTPYVEDLNRSEIKFLESSVSGLEVVGLKSFHLKSNLEIGNLSSDRILQSALALIEEVSPDGLFLSCTNMASSGIIQELERKFDFPVISSNTASLFGLLKLLRHRVRIEGFGRLFSLLIHRD